MNGLLHSDFKCFDFLVYQKKNYNKKLSHWVAGIKWDNVTLSSKHSAWHLAKVFSTYTSFMPYIKKKNFFFFYPNHADSTLSLLTSLWRKKFTQGLCLIIFSKLFLTLCYMCAKEKREKHLIKMNIKYFHLLEDLSVQRRRKSWWKLYRFKITNWKPAVLKKETFK